MVETGTAVVASCLPTILPAMRALGSTKALQSFRGSFSRLTSMSKSLVFSRNKSGHEHRSDSTTTINPDGNSYGETPKEYELRPVNSEGGTGSWNEVGKIHAEKGYNVEHIV